MTVPVAIRQDIREMDAWGVPRAEIARRLGVSRNTVAKYADSEDMSPSAPIAPFRAKRAVGDFAEWMESVLEADLGAPRKQRHTAKRLYDRLVAEQGYTGSYSSVCRFVSAWKKRRVPTRRDDCLELDWSPGTMQADFGNFRCIVAGRPTDLKLLVATLPHSNSRYCIALESQKSECLCDGLREIFEWIGRAPHSIVLDNATEAGRMVRGEVTESKLFSQFRLHYRCASRYCNPYSGNEKGSVENAVGFLRRNLLVPEPRVASVKELNANLRAGCDRINAMSSNRDGKPSSDAVREDLAGMLALPGVAFDAVRWVSVKANKLGKVEVDGVSYMAGPSWHSWDLLAGMRRDTVEIVDGRGRKVAILPRAWRPGSDVRNPASLLPALLARPRAFGESTIRADMPDALVASIDGCGKDSRRKALRAISRAAEASGFDAACRAAATIFKSGRIPDDASTDMLARRICVGDGASGGPDLSIYDAFIASERRLHAC